ncbi:15230_t:CDS:2 [Entrophospora sp. SA101]|nr:15230_t:CDS:2 [Entrophospora sp. SA101]CAJ0920553.1 1345_t:CDS:2 [Entrophospora sp. SA101]
MPVAKIAPSMLSSDFSQLANESDRIIKDGADWLHMGTHFVPNITIGAPVIQSLRKHTNAFLDCHLMVDNPGKWVDDFAKAGASMFTFHIEAMENPEDIIDKIHKADMKVGIAIKPKTPIEAIFPFGDKIDMCLVMTVEPEKFPELDIEVDGGLALDTIDQAVEAGANVIVAGTSIFKAQSPKDVISTFREKINAVQIKS